MGFKSILAMPQGRLGQGGLIALLVLASLVMPLSLDMYTPAVPHMAEQFSTTEGMVNLTLVGYFLFFAVGLLLFGPVSDRRGRRPVLLAGAVVYTVAGVLCALSVSIEMLIGARVVQALGAGAVNAVATAVVKDAIVEERREAVLSVVQVMAVVGPVIAPMLGALILQVANWHVTFLALAVAGLACVVMALLFEETLPQARRHHGGLRDTFSQFKRVVSNRGFDVFLAIVALYNLPFMAYIAVGSYIYIMFFGQTELQYGLYFGLAALLTAFGPFIWLFVSRFMRARTFTSILIVVSLVAGVGILLVGETAPLTFCLLFLVFALAEASVRPYSTAILLRQQDDADGATAGAASSVINCTHTLVGSLGMLLAHLPWANYVQGVGALIVASMGVALLGWIAFLRSGLQVRGLGGREEKTKPGV